MHLKRADIEPLLPQKGAMCFLNAVTGWDHENICCTAIAPDAEHPLLRNGKVAAIVAVEYAAQATALHGALLDAASSPKAGMLVKLHGVELHCTWFPVNQHVVTVHAKLLFRTAGGCSYSFQVDNTHQAIASGSLLVAFQS